MRLFHSTGRVEKTFRLVLLSLIVVFVLSTLIISFYGAFPNRIKGYVLSPEDAQSGSEFYISMMLSDSLKSNPVKGAKARVAFYINGRLIGTQDSITDEYGRAEVKQKIPVGETGSLLCEAEAKSPEGTFKFSKHFKIHPPNFAEIVTDRLEYAPGDSIFFKCASETQFDSNSMTISLFSSGTLLYSDIIPVSEYGFAVGTIPLGSMVKSGEYEIRAECGGSSSSKKISVVSAVDGSIKLKSSVSPSYFENGGKNKITISATENQGIALRNAHVSVFVCEKSGESILSEKRVSGDTDDSGKFSFEYSAGKYEKEYLSENSITVCVKAIVRKLDSEYAEIEKKFELSPVPFKISFFPEDSSLTPGILNRVFIFTSYPDGSPAMTKIEGIFGNRIEKFTSNKSGFCEFWIEPSSESGMFPIFKATNSNGSVISAPFDVSKYISSCSYAISSSKTCVKAGFPLNISVKNAHGNAPITLFLVKGSDIISSKTISLTKDEILTDFMIPQDIDGLCRLIAVRRRIEGSPELKMIDFFVADGNLLSMKISLDKKVYHPADIAEVAFDSDLEGGNEGFSGMIASKLIAGEYGNLREIFDEIPSSLSSDNISLYLSNLKDQENPDSPDVQEFFRFAFSTMESGHIPLLFDDVAKSRKEAFESFRAGYYKGIFSWAMKISLLISLIAFIFLAFFAFRDVIATSMSKNAPPELEKDELAGAFILNLGVPMTALITIFISVCVMSLRHITVNAFITSKMIIVSAGIAIFLLFLCELALAHSISCHSQKKLDLEFINIMRLAFLFIAGIAFAGALVITASANLWGIWGYETLINGNMKLMEIVALCFIMYPVLSFMITFLRLGKSENNKYYRPVFLTGLSAVAGVIIYFSFTGYSNFVSSPSFPSFITSNPKESANVDVVLPLEKKLRADISTDSSSSFTSSLDSFGMAFERFPIPMTSGKMTLRSVAYTNKGISNPFEKKFEVSRPCMLSFSSPSSMIEGDCETIPFRVKNACSKEKDIILSVRTEGSLKSFKGNFKMHLMPYEERIKNISVVAKSYGSGKINAEAICDDYSEKKSSETSILRTKFMNSRNVCGRFSGLTSQKIRLSDKELNSFSGGSIRICPGILSNYKACLDSYSSLNPLTCPEAMGHAGMASRAITFVEPENKAFLSQLKIDASKNIQNMLSCMNSDGSFSIFGDSPPDIWMTSSAIETLSEATAVIQCDQEAINKSSKWLFSKQQKNGSWENNLRLTAKTLYSLNKAGIPENKRMRDAYSFIKKRILASSDPFALAYSALYAYEKDRDTFDKVVGVINKNALHTHGICYWKTGEGLYSCVPGITDDIQATSLVLRVLLNANGYDDLSKRALAFILSSRIGDGSWGSREASCEALKVISEAIAKTPDGFTKFSVFVNGKETSFSYGKEREAYFDIKIDSKDLANDNEIKILCSENVAGAYIISMNFCNEQKSELLKDLKIISKPNAKKLPVGGVLAVSLSVSNVGDSEFRNLLLSCPVVSGFAFIEKPGDKIIKTGSNRYIFINRLSPDEKFLKTIYLRNVHECSVTIPPAFVFSITNPNDRAYGNSAHIKAVIDYGK